MKIGVLSLVVFFGVAMAVALLPAPARAAAPHLAEQHEAGTALTGLLPAFGMAHEVASASAPAGQESVLMQARLAAGSDLIGLPINWSLNRVLPTGGTETLAVGQSAAFAAPTMPGDYRVLLQYGTAQYLQDFTVEAGQQLTLTFIFDIGGMRILSRLKEMSLPYGFAMKHDIYSEDGHSMGRLAARTENPGELLRLPAGRYRIESRLGPGNARANMRIEVRAGFLTTVEIDHRAGVVSFTNTRGKDGWTVRDLAGRAVATISEAISELILEPGTYRVEQGLRSTAFTVEPGENTGVVLPE